MRLLFQKRSALKLASRIIPQSEAQRGSETPISETKCAEIGKSNYPAKRSAAGLLKLANSAASHRTSGY